MAKIKVKNLVIAAFVALTLVTTVGIANAQEILPKGGDSFETAVEIQPGNYQRDSLEEN